MKWRKAGIGIAVILIAMIGCMIIRSVVGWKPYKNIDPSDLNSFFVLFGVNIAEDAEWWNTGSYSEAVKMVLKDTRVYPYFGEYDSRNESVMYFVYAHRTDKKSLNRIGVTLDPEPILTIGAKAYRIDREKAERLKNIWELTRGE